jgi:hypothetical protein
VKDDGRAVPLVDDIIYSELFVQSGLDIQYFLNKIHVSPDQILLVAKETTGQRDNALWSM